MNAVTLEMETSVETNVTVHKNNETKNKQKARSAPQKGGCPYKLESDQLNRQCANAIAPLLRQIKNIENKIDTMEKTLKSLRDDYRYAMEFVIPETMYQYGCSTLPKFVFLNYRPIGFTHESGQSTPINLLCNGVAIEDDMHVSIPETDTSESLEQKLVDLGEAKHIKQRRSWNIDKRSLKRIVRDTIADGQMSVNDWGELNVNIHEYQKTNVKKIAPQKNCSAKKK